MDWPRNESVFSPSAKYSRSIPLRRESSPRAKPTGQAFTAKEDLGSLPSQHSGYRIQITLDTYSHVLPSMQREVANKLDRLLG